jgi:hypothetical protein
VVVRTHAESAALDAHHPGVGGRSKAALQSGLAHIGGLEMGKQTGIIRASIGRYNNRTVNQDAQRKQIVTVTYITRKAIALSIGLR